MHVNDLVHRFLLDSGYTRASLVSDAEELYINGDQSQSYRPAFLVINPDNGDPLAVIDVSSAERGDQAADRAEKTARYARKTDGKNVQGFVITVDKGNPQTGEQVRFVRVWPNQEYQNISTQMFPDLEALTVSRKLSLKKSERLQPGTVEMDTDDEDEVDSTAKPRIWVPYLLAVLLLTLAFADWFMQFAGGSGFLQSSQILLIIAAAVLLSLPQLISANRGADRDV